MAQFHGVYPAMITPLTKEEKINIEGLEKLIAFQKGQNAEGFYIGGATGEGLLLDLDERKKLAEKSCELIGDQATKIVHIVDMNFRDTIELAKHAQSVGADAISAIPPFYFKYDDDDVFEYYKKIAEAVDIPLIIYYTMAANTNISQKLFDRLFAVENIAGVKWTSRKNSMHKLWSRPASFLWVITNRFPILSVNKCTRQPKTGTLNWPPVFEIVSLLLKL